MNPMVLAIILFVVMYILLLAFSEQRWLIALGFAGIFLVTGLLPIDQAIPAINWNVLMMLAGTMVLVKLFIDSQMPLRMAEEILKITPNVQWAIVALSLFAGIISAFVDNVATVLMVAPVGLAVAKKFKTNPVPVIISIAVSSNLQGAATLVGDTTSILLGSHLNMEFNDFIWFRGRPGIFFAVEGGALLTIPVLLFLFRKERVRISSNQRTIVNDHTPTILLFGTIVLLIIASQVQNKTEMINGLICCSMALVGILYTSVRQDSSKVMLTVIKAVDYKTLLLLSGLFVVIEGLTYTGVIDTFAELFVHIGGTSVFLMYVIIVGVSVLLSAFIDNIPYVAAMLPVVGDIAGMMGIEPYLFSFGLLIGATLGGNITPIGASANIAGIGILQKEGFKVRTKNFIRIGIPFTLIAAVSGAAVVWLFWAH